MSAYTSQYPSVEFDPAYKKFFEDFYATSDTPDAHEKYIEQFTKDATLVMASKKAVGSDRTSSITSSIWPLTTRYRDPCPAQVYVGEGRKQSPRPSQDLPLRTQLG